jgi:hypothetical protein
MRVAILVLFVALLAVLAFSASVTAPGPSKAFASPVPEGVPPGDPCARYCNGTIHKFCGTTPSGNHGCDHVVNNTCVFTLCQ